MILILGNSDLAENLKNNLDGVVVIGRPDYDFCDKESCDKVINSFNPDVVINTFAVNQHADPWDILLTNLVATTYITNGFYEKLKDKHIINISSASTYWVSFPDIDTGRMFYNFSKDCLSNFGKHYNRKIIDSKRNSVSTIEIPAFSSKFNDYIDGIDIQKITNTIKLCIENKLTHVSLLGQ